MNEVILDNIASFLLVSLFSAVFFSSLLLFVFPWTLFLCNSAYPGLVAGAVLLLVRSYDSRDHSVDSWYSVVAGSRCIDLYQAVAVDPDLDCRSGIHVDTDLSTGG